MKIHSNVMFALAILFLFTAGKTQENKSTVQSKDGTTLAMEISFDYDTGVPTALSFDVRTNRKKVWLGVSFYPKSTTDYLREGEHQQIELGGETTDKVVKVGKKFIGGTFETAVWGKKVPRSECTVEDCYWCGKNGFHLDELLSYKSGSFTYTR